MKGPCPAGDRCLAVGRLDPVRAHGVSHCANHHSAAVLAGAGPGNLLLTTFSANPNETVTVSIRTHKRVQPQ